MLVLVSLVSCAAIALVGCGDDTSSGGGGNGGEAPGGGAQGGDGNGGTPSNGGGGEGTGGGTAAATCDAYCTTITEGCVAANAQYASKEACVAECAAFPQGDAGAMSGNSLECRAYHASVAAGGTDPAIHCVHAGPLGGGPVAMAGCVDEMNVCNAFCQIAEEVCGDIDGYYEFTSFDDCKTKCGTIDNTTADFNIDETSGDTLACRMYHLSVAATDETHCAHLGTEVMGGGPVPCAVP
ncbi:MAG: hypothetical protein HOW73_00685 [Polyangiaceae bacterium]|nr:hypothetical protein [Polyangiaceae bacterium]